MRRIEVKVNTANVLRSLGTLYRNPAEAIKEYVSNALDSFLANPGTVDVCQVDYKLTAGSITINCNTPGMNQKEFEAALQSVADSVKQKLEVYQIGRLGIGIWAFHQCGRRAEFLSKKGPKDETIKVVLKEGDDHAEVSSATKKEQLSAAGMQVKITSLKTAPTIAKSPLSASRLCKVFAEKFDSYLRKGLLRINISSQGKDYKVEPMEITLPKIAKDYSVQYLDGNLDKKVELFLWFEPAGKGRVGIRHMGIPIVEDIQSIQAYGLEESIYAKGDLFGYIDADFLSPLPARTAFEENQDWISFLTLLDRIRPSIEAEVQLLRAEMQTERAQEIYEKAIDLARDILQSEGLTDLEWLRGGRIKPRGPVKRHETHPTTKRTGKHRTLGTELDEEGLKISLLERPFEDGPSHHSQFNAGVLQVNTLNPDYQEEMSKSGKDQVYYIASLIGKEVVAFNDKTGLADASLEKALTFSFAMRRKK